MLSLTFALLVRIVVPMSVGGSVSFEPTAVRQSALRSVAAVRAIDPEVALELEMQITVTESSRPGDRAGAWTSIHNRAYRVLVEDWARHLDREQLWARLEPSLAADLQRVEQLDQPWLPRPARQTLGRIESLARLSRQAASRSEFDRAERLATPIAGLLAEVEQAHGNVVSRYEDEAQRRAWDEAARKAIHASRGGRSAVLVDKWHHRVHLAKAGVVVATWIADLGRQPLERKLHQGDRATPEGSYHVAQVKGRGRSRFYKALLLDYPNAEDRRRYEEARARGLAPSHGAGGLIEIHGHGGRGVDWTDGCIAVTDPVMDRLLEEVSVGTSVTILGRISEGALR